MRKKIALFTCLCFCFCVTFSACAKEDVIEPYPTTIRVLFIGTSHTYCNDMPKIFMEIARQNGIDTEVTMLATGGQNLLWHSQQPSTQFNILYGNYDYIILQNAAHPFWEWELDEGIPALQEFLNETDADVILFMTWPEKHLPEDMAEIQAGFARAAETTGYRVAPVGIYFYNFAQHYPDVEVYDLDGSHASEFGSYVTATVLHETILGDIDELIYEDILENYKKYIA